MLRIIRRLLLRIGYTLPAPLQRPFARYLYDTCKHSLLFPGPDNAIVRFEFVGGCRDGEIVEGFAANPFYWSCDRGTVGQIFSVASDAAVDSVLNGEPTGPVLNHRYRVAEKSFVGGITHVRAVAVP
jgi:hypothetical protein